MKLKSSRSVCKRVNLTASSLEFMAPFIHLPSIIIVHHHQCFHSGFPFSSSRMFFLKNLSVCLSHTTPYLHKVDVFFFVTYTFSFTTVSIYKTWVAQHRVTSLINCHVFTDIVTSHLRLIDAGTVYTRLRSTVRLKVLVRERYQSWNKAVMWQWPSVTRFPFAEPQSTSWVILCL